MIESLKYRFWKLFYVCKCLTCKCFERIECSTFTSKEILEINPQYLISVNFIFKRLCVSISNCKDYVFGIRYKK